MAENIVASMFGLGPTAFQNQQIADERKRALEYAQLTPTERGNAAFYDAGTNLGRLGVNLLGLQDPAEQAAKQQQEIQSQIDHSTPEGLMRGAQMFNQMGNARMAYMYQQAAASRQAQMQEVAKNRAAEIKSLAEAEKALRENKNLEKVVEGVPGAPDKKREVLVDKNTGQRFFEGEPYTPKAAATNIGVTVGAPDKVTKFSNEYDEGVKLPLSVLESASLGKKLINEASTSNNSQAWEAARTTIAKAVGESRLSNEDIRRVGVDPRLVQGALDWVSKKTAGVPGQDVLQQLYALATVLEKNSEFRINQKSNRIRAVAKQAGLAGDFDVLFPKAESYTGRPSATTSNIIEFKDIPKRPK